MLYHMPCRDAFAQTIEYMPVATFDHATICALFGSLPLLHHQHRLFVATRLAIVALGSGHYFTLIIHSAKALNGRVAVRAGWLTR